MMDRGEWSHVTATGTVKTGGGEIVAILLTGGSAAATLTIYDNTVASGTVLATLAAPIGQSVPWTPGVKRSFGIGLHAVISGAGASAEIAHV